MRSRIHWTIRSKSRDDSLDNSQDESPDDSLVYSLHPWVAIFLLSDLFRCERSEGVIPFLRWLVAPTISAVGRRNDESILEGIL